MIALIGSRAANYHIEGFRIDPKDHDIICSYDDMVEYRKTMPDIKSFYPINSGKKFVIKNDINEIVEIEIAWPGSSSEKLLQIIKNDPGSIEINNGIYAASLNVLYMLKMSHRFLKNSPHFKKTMIDIYTMRDFGAVIPLELWRFFEERQRETYNYAHPKLNQNKDKFFAGDGVEYIYDHDTIHESVKMMDYPAYTYFKDDQSEVWCSKDKFFAWDESVRLNAVLEESLVLALERSQIPFPHIDPDKSFEMALIKVCTSITSGWFREYAWDHYYEVVGLYNKHRKDYVTKFWNDVKLEIVRKL